MGLAASEAEIREFCLGYLRKSLELPAEEIVPEASFARLGLDSASSVGLLLELEEWLGLELSPEATVDYPTIAELARFLAAGQGGTGAAG
jgi:acyl carrier protein